jgi:hypothetical protein
MRRALLMLAMGTALALESPAVKADPVAAEALFREARGLLETGDVDAACEKFEASAVIEPSSGTLLNLAACRAKQGRTATAWAYFISAARSARSQNRPSHEKEAEQRAAELEPELSHLTIEVVRDQPGLKILRNGSPVEKGSLGSKVPLDPGPVVIEASAPGYQTVTVELTIGKSRDERLVTIPALLPERSQEPPGPVVSESRAARRESRSSPLPWVIGGFGAAALVTGSVFGVLALSSNAEAERLCHQKTSSCPPADLPKAREAENRRDTQATISTIGVGLGVVGVGVAGILLLTSPSREEKPRAAWLATAELGKERALFQLQSRF